MKLNVSNTSYKGVSALRTETEMFDLILTKAAEDDRILAVYMNGSRTNPHAPKDLFQDYDIVYVVNETAPFVTDHAWIDYFGERLMIQEPDKNDAAVGKPVNIHKSYTYLMLFTDGNRIDLHVETVASMQEGYKSDSLTVPLLDKAGILPAIAPASDQDYRVKKPTEAEFLNNCNEFWWCLQNVAKGIWRDELPYAKEMFEQVVRVPLNEMVSWWIGHNHDFQVSTGKMGKYFKDSLPEKMWLQYEQTYSGPNVKAFWTSIFAAISLFSALAKELAKEFQYTYHQCEEDNMLLYVRHVQALPADAKTIF